MKVILQEEVKKMGKKGEIIEVAEGYARNFLLPKKLAILATEKNMNILKTEKEKEQRDAEKQKQKAKETAAQIMKVSLELPVKTGEGGKLFGAVTGKDIAIALQEKHNIVIDKRCIDLKEALKHLGEFNVSIKLHQEISAKLNVRLVSKE